MKYVYARSHTRHMHANKMCRRVPSTSARTYKAIHASHSITRSRHLIIGLHSHAGHVSEQAGRSG